MDTSTAHISDTQAKPPVISLLIQAVQIIAIASLNLLLWPLYAVACLIWHRPPIVPHVVQAKRYIQFAWNVNPPAPGISRQARSWLTLSIIRKLLMAPLQGLAWLLDELLYGKALNQVKVTAPIFVISGGRSGSTQMTRYIEADPDVTAPNLLQCMFPYLWLWKLVPNTIGRFTTPEKVRAMLASMMPPELIERHEFDPFKADTFDGALYSSHLNPLAVYLGPHIAAKEFNFAAFLHRERSTLERAAVQLIDRIGHKHLLFTGDAASAKPRRLFIKGHFLCAATALERQYPDAVFLTVVRDPAKRLQSGINYLRVNPSDPAMGPPPWAWLAAWLLQTESDYCRIEQAWYSQKGGAKRCVVSFADFVADLEGTMQYVYEECFGQSQLPPHVPRSHPPRDRQNYIVNYSLAELGIDEAELRRQLADYVAWCQPTHCQSERKEALS